MTELDRIIEEAQKEWDYQSTLPDDFCLDGMSQFASDAYMAARLSGYLADILMVHKSQKTETY